MSNPVSSHGFTLIELMVTVLILSIFAAIAVPGFTDLIRDSRTQSVGNELDSLIQFARSTSVTRRSEISVCVGADSVWTVKSDCASAATIRSMKVPQGVQAESDTSELNFHSNGTVAAAMNIAVCREDNSGRAYLLSVQRSGFISQRVSEGNGSCTP
ncbi:GspH/FimT family pseudopilin [Pseudomonas sp. ZM23]|uniref:Type II secretion system protein H n=1 Tax=Pseudomonas triclosanedens TaxID=2961893 RepID=A0ABY6ZWB2_9PSED|nr:GspH/FimT family pseudopilin [Pseudomonas triclosanedens]MCP8465178.1 GspH/FimT family pseudopilin [Pseudomonas triclosanedens]MCP8470882.1 GspH/FimT family pseudopilin [Pseudomonas triclosanedens]MCP8476478.1 GspH/FimT family pseudopilin [Pseudomonas triclosanedens]WAI49066.1 GspH/FimT family pseudopilin [Pseudomonas triclosanedens]